jgi:glutamate racemase
LPANVPVLATVPKVRDRADRRRTVRFAVLATLATLIACVLEASLFLKLHPIL